MLKSEALVSSSLIHHHFSRRIFFFFILRKSRDSIIIHEKINFSMGARFFHELKYKSWSRVVIYSRTGRKFSTGTYRFVFFRFFFDPSGDLSYRLSLLVEIKGETQIKKLQVCITEIMQLHFLHVVTFSISLN